MILDGSRPGLGWDRGPWRWSGAEVPDL